MSRLDQGISQNPTFTGIIEKIIVNEPRKYDNTPRTLLIDADSIVYTSIYKSEDDFEECKYKFENKIQEITINIEKWYNITKTYIYIKGDNNFRYALYKDYKANRPSKHPYISLLYEHIKENIDNVVVCHGAEADDYIYTSHILNNNDSILALIDKDLFQMSGRFYLYNTTDVKKGEFLVIDEMEARHNLAVQCLMGDSSDNINFSPGIGKAYCQRHLKKGMTDLQYMKKIFEGYLKAWKGDKKKAKEMMKLTYNLVKLKNMTENYVSTYQL